MAIKGWTLSLALRKNNDNTKRILSYAGDYKTGIRADEVFEKDSQLLGGIKFDLCVGNIARPIPCVWLKEFWKSSPTISSVMEDTTKAIKWFGANVYKKLLEKQAKLDNVPFNQVRDMKFGCANPWKGKYWFVFRLPPYIPVAFLSIRLWKFLFYIGFKSSKIDPFPSNIIGVDQGDCTWTSLQDEILANKEHQTYYRAIVPTVSLRFGDGATR